MKSPVWILTFLLSSFSSVSALTFLTFLDLSVRIGQIAPAGDTYSLWAYSDFDFLFRLFVCNLDPFSVFVPLGHVRTLAVCFPPCELLGPLFGSACVSLRRLLIP